MTRHATAPTLLRATAIVAMLAIAPWLGGLVALGALAAPVVFAMVPMPWSADAMTVVFRRFDLVAMGGAAVLLTTEAARVLARAPYGGVDRLRAAASTLAAAAAVYEGMSVSPRIAALHDAGAIRGTGPDGIELSNLHDLAEALGKSELALLVAIVVLVVLTSTRSASAQ